MTDDRLSRDATGTQQAAAPESNGALVEQLQSEIEFLRQRIEQHEVADSEMRRLMMADKQELQRLRQHLAIAATIDPETTEPRAVAVHDASTDKHKTNKPKSFWNRLIDAILEEAGGRRRP